MATCKHESKVTVRRDGSRITSTVCGRVRTVSDGMNIAEKLSLVTCKLCLRRSAARMRDFTSGGGPDCKGTGEVDDMTDAEIEAEYVRECARIEEEEQRIRESGVCPDCGAKNDEEAQRMCRPSEIADTGDYSCAASVIGMLWTVDEPEQTARPTRR